ncbi:MAG TPA: hypothetical protein DDY77_05405 [Clostridiales bacterium]|nr:hypothetical protein [Clostridiales bacterium]
MVKQNENVETKAKTEIEAEIKTETVQPSGIKSQSQLAIEAAEELAEKTFVDEDGKVVDTAIKYPPMYFVRGGSYNVGANTYFEYLVPVAFCGKVKHVHFKAADRDGYDQLETLFTQSNKLMFNFEEHEQTDELGNKRAWTTYSASYTDNDGFEWQVPVRPIRSSDKSLIENYLRFMKHELQKAKA